MSRAPRAARARAVGVAALLAGLAACASAPPPPPVMTVERLERLLGEEEGVTGLVVEGDELRFVFDGVRMVCVVDRDVDRLRLVAPVARESALTVVQARILLQANFHRTADARYAISGGILFALFAHPFASLSEREVRSAVHQVAALVHNFGSSYSSGVLSYE